MYVPLKIQIFKNTTFVIHLNSWIKMFVAWENYNREYAIPGSHAN